MRLVPIWLASLLLAWFGLVKVWQPPPDPSPVLLWLPWLELTIATALAMPGWRRPAGILGIVVGCAFLGNQALRLLEVVPAPCGCGSGIDRHPWLGVAVALAIGIGSAQAVRLSAAVPRPGADG